MKIALLSGKRLSIVKNVLLLLVIFFISGDTYLCGTNSNETFLTIARASNILIIVYILYCLRFRVRISNNKSKFYAYAVMIIVFVGISMLHNDNINRIVVVVIYMTLSLMICMLFSFKEYVRCFNSAMYFISIMAILFTVLAYISPALIRMLPIIVNSAGTRIYTCGFAGLLEGFVGQSVVRTQGIFWEPGVFQMYLNLAIAFELLYKDKAEKKKVIAFSIALFLTFSTTGYIVFAWILLSHLFLKKSKNGNNVAKRFVVTMTLFIFGVIILQFTPIGDMIFGKIVDRNNTNFGSMTTRMAGIIVSSRIAFDNPLFGIGMNDMSDMFFEVAYSMRTILGGWTHDNTNTLFYRFAAHGIPYGLFFSIGTFKFGNCFGKGKGILRIAIFGMLFLMYVGENLQYSIFPYIIVLYGYGWREGIRYSNG